MGEEKIKYLISQPESSTQEFKLNIPSSGAMARELSAFANADGGTIIYGVNEEGKVVGISNPDRATEIFDQAITRINPQITVVSELTQIKGKNLFKVDIESEAEFPVFSDGVLYNRKADTIVPMTSDAIFEGVQKRAKDGDEFLFEVKRLADTIESMNLELIRSRSWKSKLPDMIFGGIIGAIISLFLAFLIGM